MATIRKVGTRWRVEIRRKGVRMSEYFNTKSQADRWAAQTELGVIEGSTNKESNKTLGDVLRRYADEVTPRKLTADKEAMRIAFILTDPIANIKLIDLANADIADWRDRRLASFIRSSKGAILNKKVSPATVRRELTIIRAALNYCINNWGWLNKSPMAGIDMPPDSPARDRLISDQEIEMLNGNARR